MTTLVEHLPVTTRTQRLLGRGLQVVAVLGAVIALLGGVVGWRVVGAVDDVAVESTAVTADAMAAVEDTLELAGELVESVEHLGPQHEAAPCVGSRRDRGRGAIHQPPELDGRLVAGQRVERLVQLRGDLGEALFRAGERLQGLVGAGR